MVNNTIGGKSNTAVDQKERITLAELSLAWSFFSK
jgi:hypothetical protein